MVQVGWFGKVPSYKEYASEQVDGKLPLWLRNWVENGHDLFVSKLPGSKGEISRNLRFILIDHQSDSCLVGVLSGSEDSIGRRFPVTHFAVLPLSMFSELTFLPVLVGPVWRLLENTGTGELEVVREQIEDWQKQGQLEVLPSSRRHIEELTDKLTIREFLNLSGVFSYENFEKLRNLGSGKGKGGKVPPVCIKGLLPGEKTLFFLCLWYLITKNVFCSSYLPHCFLAGSGATGIMEFNLFFRWPLKSDFLYLLGVNSDTEYTVDLTRNGGYSDGPGNGLITGTNLDVSVRKFLESTGENFF